MPIPTVTGQITGLERQLQTDGEIESQKRKVPKSVRQITPPQYFFESVLKENVKS